MTAKERRRESGALAILRAVHCRPGIERATIGRELNMASGFVAETVAHLHGLDLLTEHPALPRGERGRPTTTLHPHPQGPVVLAAAITHQRWKVVVAQLGGTELARIESGHRRKPDQVLVALGKALRVLHDRYGRLVRAAALAVPGTVSDNQLHQAANLGWRDIDLSVLWRGSRTDLPFLTGNDATFAAVAEVQRGAAIGAKSMLHLFIDVGVGGAYIENGEVLLGATGSTGEFGHMPFGDAGQRCACGAWGCWNTSLDGASLARALDEPAPADEWSFIRRVLSLARPGTAADLVAGRELRGVQGIASSIGRGAAGLVNAFDPNVVTLGGIGRDLLEVASDHLYPAYLAGLMEFRTAAPPPLIASSFGNDAPLIGAIEEAFGAVLNDKGIDAWSLSKRELSHPVQTPKNARLAAMQ